MNQLALELDINSAVDNIRDVVLELLNCERVTLFLVDNKKKELRQVLLPLTPAANAMLRKDCIL